jgi:hypothetical protein
LSQKTRKKHINLHVSNTITKLFLIVLTPFASFISPRTAKAVDLKVLILHAEGYSDDDEWALDIKTKLSAFPDFSTIDLLSMLPHTPSLSTLQQYNSILVETDYSVNQVAWGDVLSDYVDGGGGVVVMVFSDTSSWGFTGRFVSTGKNLLSHSDSNVYPYQEMFLGTRVIPNHPILEGVTSFAGGSASYHMIQSTTLNGGIIVARWSDNSVFAAVSPSGKVVELNFFPPSVTVRGDFWDTSTDGARLMRNALVSVSSYIPIKTVVQGEWQWRIWDYICQRCSGSVKGYRYCDCYYYTDFHNTNASIS